MNGSRLAVVCGSVVTLMVIASCGTREVELPEYTGPSVTVSSSTGISIGVSNPIPTPTPVPGPTPSPTPSAQPTPTAGTCSLPAGTGDGENCPRTEPSFLTELDEVIDQVVQQQPSLFDLNDAKCGNCYRVKDPDGFVSAVVSGMSAHGLCSEYDGEELAVKNSNDFNDQHDLTTADNYLRRGDGSYRATCRPAAF